MKKELMNACKLKFSSTHHFFCIWHINNNVLINCKKIFDNKKTWNKFFNEWKLIMYATFERKYHQLWNEFSDRYNFTHDECVKYLYDIYIKNYRRRFIKCYINQVLHFNTIVTSRDENEHVVFKRRLKSSMSDFKTMMNEINLMFVNEHHNYLIKIKKTKIRYSIELRKFIFDQLTSFVFSIVI
jgi:hypothetical protein